HRHRSAWRHGIHRPARPALLVQAHRLRPPGPGRPREDAPRRGGGSGLGGKLRQDQLHPDGLPAPQRIWAIVTIALGIVMAVMDSSIANVALPTIAGDLHASPALSIWVVNGYQLAITISLLPLAALGDIIGYRRVYVAGLVLFTLASLFCAVSHSLPMLAVARVVQGFGGSGIMSVNSALIRFIYPHRLLGRGLSINTLIVAVSAALGPTAASAILSVGDWPWLF